MCVVCYLKPFLSDRIIKNINDMFCLMCNCKWMIFQNASHLLLLAQTTSSDISALALFLVHFSTASARNIPEPPATSANIGRWQRIWWSKGWVRVFVTAAGDWRNVDQVEHIWISAVKCHAWARSKAACKDVQSHFYFDNNAPTWLHCPVRVTGSWSTLPSMVPHNKHG